MVLPSVWLVQRPGAVLLLALGGCGWLVMQYHRFVGVVVPQECGRGHFGIAMKGSMGLTELAGEDAEAGQQ
jgi:hypothetical protein